VGFWQLLGFRRLRGPITVGVKDMQRAVAWYRDLFGLDSWRNSRDEVVLGYTDAWTKSIITLVILVQIPEGRSNAAVARHPVLFTKSLKRVFDGLVSRGTVAGPIQKDSGGNHFFQLQDLEGNKIEICLEPGSKYRD